MSTKLSAFLSMLLLPTLVVPFRAQDVGRVAPASLPLPLPGRAAVAPDVLRANNPWNLPVTGTWKFQLTHGSIVAGQFEPGVPGSFDASSTQGSNAPALAFDGDEATRWCASNGDLPQYLEVDLGKVRHVQNIGITWEYPNTLYQYRIQGRKERNTGQWVTLTDASAAPGVGDGPISVQAADVRYVRVTVTAVSGGRWACIRELQIHTLENGRETLWKPPTAMSANQPASVRDAFAAPGFADAKWDNIPVPSNWEMLGYSIPTYNTVDNTVGLYRRGSEDVGGQAHLLAFRWRSGWRRSVRQRTKSGLSRKRLYGFPSRFDWVDKTRPKQFARGARFQNDSLV